MSRRILILANDDVSLYKNRKELIQAFLDHKDQVTISMPAGIYTQAFEEMGCQVVRNSLNNRAISPGHDIKVFFDYRQLIKNVEADWVLTYAIKPNLYGGLAARLGHMTYAVNITGLGSMLQREGPLRKLIVWLYRRACRQAKVIIFENSENQEFFFNMNIVKRDQACLLAGAGVNVSQYQQRDYPISEGPIRFVFIGRLMKDKGVVELFEVADRLHKEGKNVEFDLVGSAKNDSHNLQERASEISGINYHGFQEDVTPFVTRAHCALLPSYHEGMANVLLEAAAMSRPLITSRIPGCQEAVVEGCSGFLVNSKDSEDLYQKVMRFIKLPYEDKREMGRQSRKHIEKNFDRREVVRKTVERLIMDETI
jgi:galacturonosyltransferase